MHREQLLDIAEFDRAEAWRGDGSGSMVAWVTGQCGVSTSTARQWVRSAANLESLPCLAEGLASGQLSLDLVEPLAEVASAETDAALRAASAHWSVRQARQLVAWHRAQREAQASRAASGGVDEREAGGSVGAADEAGEGIEKGGGEGEGEDEGSRTTEAQSNPAAREFERRTLRFNDTRRTVWVAFTKDDYATAKSALVTRVAADERRTGPSPADDPRSPDPLEYVPYDKRLYDTLMLLFRVGSTSTSPGRPAVRPRVIVHAPVELLLGCLGSRIGLGIRIGTGRERRWRRGRDRGCRPGPGRGGAAVGV